MLPTHRPTTKPWRLCALAIVCAASLVTACDENDKTSPPPTASTSGTTPGVNPGAASAANAKNHAPVPAPKLKTFRGLGLTFRYPEPYLPELATSNPAVHQIAIDHAKEPGVLTVRVNPKDPKADINLDEVAEVVRQNMGAKATVSPSKLEVAGKSYEARTVKSNQLGLVKTTDTMAVVRIGEKSYVVLTHTSDDDRERSQRMFDIVLGSLAKAE